MTDQNLPSAPEPLGILEAALYVADLDAAERFYGDVLGLERIVRVADRHVFYRVGAGVLLIFNPMETCKPSGNPDLPVPAHGTLGPGHFCFAVDRAALDTWRARLVAAGVEIEADFQWPNGARSIYFRDPAKNSIEMAEPRLWEK
ncbi:VOC family protein [uncultured Roseovarius sp.]|uniref:VOC family protein n=1 Tax=Roseovarius sp. TaxID=1486281 RepID=UPI0025E36167|nr:VOC family protein [uncultured Roseovarius sp.]